MTGRGEEMCPARVRSFRICRVVIFGIWQVLVPAVSGILAREDVPGGEVEVAPAENLVPDIIVALVEAVAPRVLRQRGSAVADYKSVDLVRRRHLLEKSGDRGIERDAPQ